MQRREKQRDARDYDLTQLHENSHGQILHRDYLAHAFRWAFARRFITHKDHILEVGCGTDKPLSKILTGGVSPHCASYTGVDLNKLKPSNSQRLTFHGEFNFVERYKELLKQRPEGWDVVVHLEVYEHMHSRFQLPFLKACYACLRPGGMMIMSTPVYDGIHMAANHIAEVTIEQLQKALVKAGFTIERRHGTFMNIKNIGKAESELASKSAITEVYKALSLYFDSDVLSNFFGPLYKDASRNNVWLCVKPQK